MKRAILALAALAAVSTSALAQVGPPSDVRPEVPPAAAPVPPAPSVVWNGSVEGARRVATDGQVVVVDVYTDWCSWCRYMDRFVYADPKMATYSKGQAFVRLNADDGREGSAFARRMRVKSYPSLFVLSRDGKLLAKHVGAFRDAGELVAWINRSAKR